MTERQDSTPLPPPTNRFGPVTLLALAGGVVMGLLGALAAQGAGSPRMARGILVSLVCVGVVIGVAAGTVVERQYPGPRWFRRLFWDRIPWGWFRFNMRFVLVVLTATAIYFGALTAWARWIGLNPGNYLRVVLPMQVSQIPVLFVYAVATLVFVNRWHVHPRASKLALAGIGAMFIATLSDAFPVTFQYAMMQSQAATSRLFRNLIMTWAITRSVIWYIGLVLIFAAALVDRNGAAPRTENV